MKAILQFDLDDYSDRQGHKRAVNATNAYIALHDIENILRKAVKYETVDNKKVEDMEPVEVAYYLRQEFYEILNTNKIDMDDLE